MLYLLIYSDLLKTICKLRNATSLDLGAAEDVKGPCTSTAAAQSNGTKLSKYTDNLLSFAIRPIIGPR